MNQTTQSILSEYERRSAEEMRFMHANPEEFGKRVDEFLICVGPETGRMLHLLATGMKAKRILEVGASYGYSYQALVRTKPDMESVLLPVGSGIELSRKRGGQSA